ncbi:MAG: dihydrofolate reductase, partial [Prevotella sp.]|nr:dihydrofolate reductase [Prevotella sp.]
MEKENFKYVDQSFDEIQMLRYRLKDFDRLTLQQKIYIYCLSEATLTGRDIIFEQNGKYNLDIRRLLETIYIYYNGDRQCEDFRH